MYNQSNDFKLNNLKFEIERLCEVLSQSTTKEMSKSPFTDEQQLFWKNRGVLSKKYYEYGELLEKEKDYQGATKAYWNSYQINQNEPADNKLQLNTPNKTDSHSHTEPELPSDMEGCFSLGLQYLGGIGHEANERQAAACFREAAKQGHAAAQCCLALMYEQGRGRLTRDDIKAVKWYGRAAEQKYGDALNTLAWKIGDAAENSSEFKAQILKWFKQAAKLGHPKAQVNFGVYTEPKNIEEAENCYRRAAAQGENEGVYNLERLNKLTK